ncbi:MAG: hypothetical protein Q9218_006098 [Villophora microphyllina]
MASSAPLSESMQRITKAKLNVLIEKHDAYEKKKSSTFDAVNKTSNLSEQVTILLDALVLHDVPTVIPNLSTDNIRRFLNQRRDDPSVSTAMLEEWKSDLEKCLNIHSHKYEHASLFGQLVTEWLEKPNDNPTIPQRVTGDSSSDGSEESFEPVGRQEMYDQRKEWESLVFDTTKKSDPEKIKEYLSTLFNSTTQSKKLTKTPLEIFRTTMKEFDLGKFDLDSIRWSIRGLLKADLLPPTKRLALSDVNENKLVLEEMVDVLNIHLEDLDNWSWGDEPVSVEARRQVNGKYRVYMDEEILQALLIHFVGLKWAIHFKSACVKFFHSGAWQQSPYKSMDKKARTRREEFLGTEAPATTAVRKQAALSTSSTVRNERRKDYEQYYFMTQLPSSVGEGSRDYGEDGSGCGYDADAGDEEKKSPMEVKQSLLYLVTTESLLNTSIYGSFTILQSDFRWFGPSLPHSSIYTVLEFLGVRNRWLRFFRKFLEAPLKFVQDGPEAPTQVRRCGIPIEHALSDFLGEAVLFVLDFAVNEATQTNLYRFHDDLWFWGQEDICINAWQTTQKFTKVMGLSMNEKKTGSVTIRPGSDASKPARSLPEGKIQWGFLVMDPSGEWVINGEEVDEHIEELRRQLKACKSIFATIQAWNVYVSRFLANNFGRPQNCLGQHHVDMVISAFDKIQQRVFSKTFGSSNLVEYLKRMIAERFDVKDLPDGFFYFPLELGGLELRNPLVPLLLVRTVASTGAQKQRMLGEEKQELTPKERIQDAFEKDEEDYEERKKRWDEGDVSSKSLKLQDQPFMSLEEFTRYREETSWELLSVYQTLQREPTTKDIELTSEVKAALEKLPTPAQTGSGMHRYWSSMNSYDKWVAQLYAGDVLKRFGGLSMGEKKLLPIGLVTMLRKEKVRWQG